MAQNHRWTLEFNVRQSNQVKHAFVILQSLSRGFLLVIEERAFPSQSTSSCVHFGDINLTGGALNNCGFFIEFGFRCDESQNAGRGRMIEERKIQFDQFTVKSVKFHQQVLVKLSFGVRIAILFHLWATGNVSRRKRKRKKKRERERERELTNFNSSCVFLQKKNFFVRQTSMNSPMMLIVEIIALKELVVKTVSHLGEQEEQLT
jgi:hypothetical protein